MIGRLHHVVLDCPEPLRLAGFYGALLGQEITYADDDWVVVSSGPTSSGLAFQRAPEHRPPRWPGVAGSDAQQVHLDVMVDDVETAEAAVRALGAHRLSPPDHPVAVYADLAGHPFCLVRRPRWAPPITAGSGEPPGATTA